MRRTALLLAFAANVAVPLSHAPKHGLKKPPARLPSYNEPAATPDTPPCCAEHGQPVVRRQVLRGANKGREYFACGNEIPCEHFAWADAARVAGDGAQQARGASDAALASLEAVNGTISRVVFRGDTGFTVARVAPFDEDVLDDGDDDEEARRKPLKTFGVRADGCLATARVGDAVTLRGRWTTHARFGKQFEADVAEAVALEAGPVAGPRSKGASFAAWLGSGVVAGVGEKTAAKIVELLGDDAESLLLRFASSLERQTVDEDAEGKLAAAFGWGDDRPAIGRGFAEELAAEISRHSKSRQSILALLERGLPVDAAVALERTHGQTCAALFAKEPYAALLAVKGWGFTRADAACLPHADGGAANPARLEFGLVHALAEFATQGHCACEAAALVDLAHRDHGALHVPRVFSPSRDALDAALDRCLASGKLRSFEVDGQKLCFTPWLDYAEETIARGVAYRSRAPVDDVDPSSGDASLSPEQREAVAIGAKAPLLVLAGGPGTGKTYAAARVVGAWRARGARKVALAAPTARGAAALGAAIGSKATTIHRLLEWSPRLGDFARNARNPLEIDALVVDELSMLEAPLAARLFAALPPHCQLLLVGDPDQLPPVGPGALLRDLLAAASVPRVTLERIFRTGAGASEASDIARDARRINAGEPVAEYRRGLVVDGAARDGVALVDADPDDGAAVNAAIVQCVRDLEAAGYDALADVQVLAPMKRGPAGTEALNGALQDLLNPAKRRGNATDASAGATPRVKDRVMQLTNDYDAGVFNGDVGLVDEVMRNGSFVARFAVGGGGRGGTYARVMYARSDVGDSVALAYALTVHKAQGAEYPVVIMPLVRDHYPMLRRALLYTAVSRAKRLLVLVGSVALLDDAVRRPLAQERVTALDARVNALIAGGTAAAAEVSAAPAAAAPPAAAALAASASAAAAREPPKPAAPKPAAPGTTPGTAPATPHLPLRKAAAEPVDDEDDERRRVLEHVFGNPGSATNSSHRVASR